MGSPIIDAHENSAKGVTDTPNIGHALIINGEVMEIELVSLRKVDSKYADTKPNKMIGYMVVRIGDVVVRDCRAMFNKEDNRYWVGMPFNSYMSDGIKKYYNIVEVAKEVITDFNKEMDKQIVAWLNLGEDGIVEKTAAESSIPDDDVPF